VTDLQDAEDGKHLERSPTQRINVFVGRRNGPAFHGSSISKEIQIIATKRVLCRTEIEPATQTLQSLEHICLAATALRTSARLKSLPINASHPR
jgi:hypothetical protein